MEIVCHIVGITTYNKQKIIDKIKDLDYNILDLDEYSKIILSNTTMLQMFKQYQIFKEAKNDKFKEIDKKMSIYWEKTMEEMIENNLNKKRKNVIIGYNHHFRNITKRININHNSSFGKFIIKVSKKDIREIIIYNLDKYRNDIINGAYPLENIDFDYIYNNRIKIETIYEKNGYLPKTLDTIFTILELSNKSINNIGLWIALKQPYNLSSNIHPKKNDKLFAFTDKIMALLSSFHFNEDELEKIYIDDTVKIKPKKEGILEKMNEKRYLYLVDNKNFIPHEKGNNIKFFTQVPVKIIDILKINNVYEEYFKNI